ncbi:putative RNA-directed DNA polymerase, eukaryota, reverse transcriptase zinc-binding domain protein [Tanacetum coccineum]
MFILKVDFEKAFDTLSWSFLDSIMYQMGFGLKWRNWIKGCLRSSFASVLVNGSPTLEFKLEKGLRQVGKDKVHVSHLQFADDDIILGEWSKPNIKNLSRILTCFYLASGLKVNFNKSKFFRIAINESELYFFASSIRCQSSYSPCTYLGLPIGANMSRSLNWNPLIERFLKRLTRWKANSLSFGGRLTLAKSVLGSLGVYFFSTFKAPKMIIKKLESIRRKFFWGGSSDVNKIAWVAWDRVIASFSKGGLNIGSLSVICSIHGPQGGLRDASLIRSKSGPWYRIAKLNEDLSVHGIDLHYLFKIKIGNRENTRFWIDKWVGDSQLSIDFPRLFRLETQPLCRVCDRYPFSNKSICLPLVCVCMFQFWQKAVDPPGLRFRWAGIGIYVLQIMMSLFSSKALSLTNYSGILGTTAARNVKEHQATNHVTRGLNVFQFKVCGLLPIEEEGQFFCIGRDVFSKE